MEAIESFERLNTDYPATGYRDQLVRREYEIAQRWITWGKRPVLNAKKAVLLSLFDEGPPMAETEELAFWALSVVRHNDPTGPLAHDASIRIADFYMKHCNYDAAAAHYDQFIAEYRKSRFCPHARLGAVAARFRNYLLNHYDTADLRMARELAELSLRAIRGFDDHVDGH